jgi:recombination protein RecT
MIDLQNATQAEVTEWFQGIAEIPFGEKENSMSNNGNGSTGLASIREYMKSDIIRAGFAEVLGQHQAAAYIQSVVIAVANSEALQKCSAKSIAVSAMRAATLRLSVDPALGKAHLVPFKEEASLVIGYKGLIELAQRTNRYRFINVSPIHEGQEPVENPITGQYTLGGYRKSDVVIGWMASFEMMNGFCKTIYMSVSEIHAHARKHSKSYDFNGGGWKKFPAAMERKTVLRKLLQDWGYLDPNDAALITNIESDDVLDGEAKEIKPEASESEPRPGAAGG